jgi:hypothetical protein
VLEEATRTSALLNPKSRSHRYEPRKIQDHFQFTLAYLVEDSETITKVVHLCCLFLNFHSTPKLSSPSAHDPPILFSQLLTTTIQHHAIMSASFESELMATIRQQRNLQATVTAFSTTTESAASHSSRSTRRRSASCKLRLSTSTSS